MSRSSMLVCPYCFDSFSSKEMAFRCTGLDPGKCPPEPDEPLRAYQRQMGPLILPRIFTPLNRSGDATHAVCQCGHVSIKTVCPLCHNELSREYASSDNMVVAMIGAKETGKSHYMAVLIHELQHRVGSALKSSLTSLDDRTLRRYDRDFARHLYGRSETIEVTQSSSHNEALRYPMLFKMSLPGKRKWFWSPPTPRTMSLAFFDTAGEDLENLDAASLSVDARYVARSAALIVLIDPLQFLPVREALGDSRPLPAINGDPVDVLVKVDRLIRETHGIGAAERINTPVAVALSKIDAVRDLFDMSSPVRQSSRHDQGLHLDDCEQMHDNISAHLMRWCPGIVRFMQDNFNRYCFFGLSALGGSPDESGRITRGVLPFRVEDPFLWILYQFRLISANGGQA
ncbi:MAG: hypothetical protein EB084_16530 [Proteobacteria bacterium]|nr:hypothetical protein [Pseudomonadota bacterium]